MYSSTLISVTTNFCKTYRKVACMHLRRNLPRKQININEKKPRRFRLYVNLLGFFSLHTYNYSRGESTNKGHKNKISTALVILLRADPRIIKTNLKTLKEKIFSWTFTLQGSFEMRKQRPPQRLTRNKPILILLLFYIFYI